MSEQINVNNLPLLCSVVIPNYNQGRYIRDAIGSIANQNYKKKEIIIVDDGSTDNSVELIEKAIEEFKDKVNIQFFQKPNGGTASARNLGIEKSNGEFIALLDADDFYYPDKIAVSIGKICEVEGIGMAYTDYDEWYPADNDKKVRRFKSPFNADLLIQHCMVATNSVYRRLCFDTVGLFNPEIRGMEDYEMYLRLSTKFMLIHIPHSLFCYRSHGMNKTLTTNPTEWSAEERKMKVNFLRSIGYTNVS